jgi:hypothetical protein
VRPLATFKLVLENAPLPTTPQITVDCAAAHETKTVVMLREIDIEPESTVVGGGN